MIDFLLGALSVLVMRGNKIVQHLEAKQALPAPVLTRCAQIADKTRATLHTVQRHLSVAQSLQRGVESGQISVVQAEPVLTVLFQAYRDNKRELDAFEEFFAGHINRFIDADRFLTQIAATIWEETKLPGLSPVAVTNTSGYFCTVASLGIVFCPPSTEDHLLTLPDFYHESGHVLPEELKTPLYGARFQQALQDHVANLHHQVRRISRPLDTDIMQGIFGRWKYRWAEEVACDTLAAHLVGPAYGWCNLHLCLQSPNVYAIGDEHPADAARTTHIFRVLKRQGWGAEVGRMESYWNQYLQTMQQKKPHHYDDYHPADLFTAVAEDVAEKARAFSSYQAEAGSLALLLNEAWQKFLSDPLGYIAWEQQTVLRLRQQTKR